MKSELSIKWDKWIESQQAVQALSPDILYLDIYGDILKNRLKAAFLAGSLATNEIAEELSEKVTKIRPNLGWINPYD